MVTSVFASRSYGGWQDAEGLADPLTAHLEKQAVTGGGDLTIVNKDKEMERNVVRRLMPIECERLQGFPDNWTRIPYRGKTEDKCPNSPRYKACGNSWAVPCVRWLGERLDAHLKELGDAS